MTYERYGRLLFRMACLAFAVSASTSAVGRGAWDKRFAPFIFDPANPDTLYLDGPLDQRSAYAFSEALDELGDVGSVVLSSQGGDVYSALLISSEIDRLGLSTRIPPNAVCFSACSFLYLAGHDRTAQGSLGVHQISAENPDFASGQVALSDIIDLLAGFGVPNELFVLMLRTSASDMYIFTAEEMTSYGLVGGRSVLGADDPKDPEEQYNLGLAHARRGSAQDYVEARRLYRLAGEQGHAEAQYNLGYLYYDGFAGTQDENYAEAVKWYRLAAEQGHVEAQFRLGQLFYDGLGVQNQSFAEAAEWYRLAAKQGHAQAQHSLGRQHYAGRGVVQDYAEAAKWYRLSADQGYARAQYHLAQQYHLGHGVIQDGTEAIRLYKLAAEQNYVEAQFSLGSAYSLGKIIPQNDLEALKWYRRAAERGHVSAQFNVGSRYLNGWGVPQDYAEAFRWHSKAAAQGDWTAQSSLGDMYSEGFGRAENFVEAVRWYTLAAEQGDSHAQSKLGDIYLNGRHRVPQNHAEAFRWYRLAAEQGDANGQAGLGFIYWSGLSVPQDDEEAVRWFALAAEDGHAAAEVALSLNYAYGDGGLPHDPQRAAELLMSAFGRGNEYARSATMEKYGADLPKDSRRAIQIWLEERGFYSGPIDGDFGEGTLTALEAYALDGGSVQHVQN